MTVIDFDMARIEREQDNTKVTVEELLRFALKEVSTGVVKKPISAFLCIVSEAEGGNINMEGYRCNLTRVEEIGYLEAFKQQQWEKWKAAT